MIELGEIKAAYGIKGWVKIFSYTRPIEQIFNYKYWHLGNDADWKKVELESSQHRSNCGLIAKIKGVDDRSEAMALAGSLVAVTPDQLPELEEGEFYWSQIIGLDVVNTKSEHFGKVTGLMETGAHDVLVVNKGEVERLIPYADSIVIKVEIHRQRIVVDWETDY